MVLTRTKVKRLVDLERPSVTDKDKTAAMFCLERRFGKDIVSLLDGRLNGDRLARDLGISKSTLSKWRKRLGIVVSHKNCFWCGMRISQADKVCNYCETIQ